jgi:hypothetical protein
MNLHEELNAGHIIDGYYNRKIGQKPEEAFTAAKKEATENLQQQIHNIEELSFEKFLHHGFIPRAKMNLRIPAVLIQAGTDNEGITTLTFEVEPEAITNIPLPLYRESILVITPARNPNAAANPAALSAASAITAAESSNQNNHDSQ